MTSKIERKTQAKKVKDDWFESENADGATVAKVLVVDDSATIREMLKEMLISMGHKAILAVDGVEAMSAVKKQPIDAVITDINMPNMDGIELIRKLRKLARVNDPNAQCPDSVVETVSFGVSQIVFGTRGPQVSRS